MSEKDVPRKLEITLEQEKALADRIKGLRPYLYAMPELHGKGQNFAREEGSIGVFCADYEGTSGDDLSASVTISTPTSDLEGFGRQDTYVILRRNLVSTSVMFDREYLRIVFDTDGKPFMERFPSGAKQIEMMAHQVTDEAERSRLLAEATKLREKNVATAALEGVDEGFNVDRYEELMVELQQIDPNNTVQLTQES